jgi:glycyl-tRNA synthetase beta chain
LLDEVTSMVEWPIAVLGNFDERFLEVPAECLISSMKSHQKYFHVVDDKGALMPCFITVSNIASKDIDQVRKGNERVIRPRLSDADFFWQQDLKHKLADHIDSLNNVVFHKQLGTLGDKTARLAALAGSIAKQLDADAKLAMRAAQLAKCDLMSEMVFEFTDLQGIMGRYYASNDGEDPAVAQAIEDHYLPRFAGDKLPADVIGQAVSIADKLDSLVGLFAIGQPPTGQKDPYALRRASLGVLRICMECDLDLDVRELISEAVNNYQAMAPNLDVPETTLNEVFDFILGRLHVYYSNQAFAADEIEAVLSLRPGRLRELDQRLRAVAAFRKLPEAESLSAANTRITNILKKAEAGSWPEQIDIDLLSEDSEKTLANVITIMRDKVEPLLNSGDYTTALTELAALREPVDAFFDNVMVMADDAAVRSNRLALLDSLRTLFLRIADLSRLQG